MHMQAAENLKTTLEYLPQSVRGAIRKLPMEIQQQTQEIRLRCSRPVAIGISGKERFLTEQGMLTDSTDCAIRISTEEIARSFQAVCSYSVYSHERDVAEGFVTIRGGCRVGICGTAALQANSPMSLRFISGLNFRIAGEYIGSAEQVWKQIGSESVGILIAGTVGSGKTTLLRDFCRLAGNRYPTSLIDERGEIAAVLRGTPQHDVGQKTDVLDGYPRSTGILTALRVLTPQYIICDEISTQSDAEAILLASGCGVNFIASCHAGNMEDLYRRSVLRPLIDAGVFQYCVFLESAGRIRTVRRLQQR